MATRAPQRFSISREPRATPSVYTCQYGEGKSNLGSLVFRAGLFYLGRLLTSEIFAIREKNLSASSGDAVLQDFGAFMEQRFEDNITFDLSSLVFVDPYGMNLLCMMARELASKFWDIQCRLPKDPDVESYLTRMKVFESLRSYVTLEREPKTGRAPVVNESLIEVCEISGRTDVDAALVLIEARVGSILEDELNYSIREITGFKNVVAELCHNILDHSGDRGYLVAQRYTNRKSDRKFAMIAVCDLGIGFKESLSSRYNVSAWSHADAILNAIRKAFSRDPTRGLGLYIVRKICQEYDGSLHIRSGDARVYWRGSRTRAYEGGLFPGSQIGITLYER